MFYETLRASATTAFIWVVAAVICILAPNLVIEGEGRVPTAAIICPA